MCEGGMLWALRLRERWLLGVGALLGASGAEPARAGFVLEPGATQIISTTSVSGFSRAFDAQGRMRRAATFSKATLETLAEHGLTRDAMVMFSFGREQEQPAYADDPGAQTRWRAMVGGRYVVARFADWAVTAQAMAGWGRSLDAAGFVGDARLVLARSLTIQGCPLSSICRPAGGRAARWSARRSGRRHAGASSRRALAAAGPAVWRPTRRRPTGYGVLAAEGRGKPGLAGQRELVRAARRLHHALWALSRLRSGATFGVWRRF